MRAGSRLAVALVVLVVLMLCTGCAEPVRPGAQRSRESSGPASATDLAAMRAAVRTDVANIRPDLDELFKRDPGLAARSDWWPVYATPSFQRLVARGTPALKAITLEIESGEHDAYTVEVLRLARVKITD